MSLGLWIKDERRFAVEKKIEKAIRADDVECFLESILELKRRRGARSLLKPCRPDFDIETLVRGQEFLMKACDYRAVMCVSSILNGDTPFFFDVNRPTPDGLFPLHHAAWKADPGVIHLLLLHGARADVEAASLRDDDTQRLPLHVALHMAWVAILGIYPLYLEASVYQLVTLICVKGYQRLLDCVQLLASKTEDLGNVFLRFAMEGNLFKLTLLLAVAQEKLAPIVEEFTSSSNLEVSEATKDKVKSVFQVFQKANGRLPEYYGVAENKISILVARLLDVDPTATDLSRLRRDKTCRSSMEETGGGSLLWGKKDIPGISPTRKYVITEEQKSHISTEVNRRIPIPIPSFFNCNCSAAGFMKRYKPVLRAMAEIAEEQKQKMRQGEVSRRKRKHAAQGEVSERKRKRAAVCK